MSDNPPLSIVWFKRDLRVTDHRPLVEAACRGPVLPLFIAEPALWQQPDMSGRQWAFVAECLEELRLALTQLGQSLIVRVGDATDVLEGFRANVGISGLWSHEETGNAWTFARDQKVASWCRTQGIPWHEIAQHGVVRRLATRNGWARRWDDFMAEPVAPAPTLRTIAGIEPGSIPTVDHLEIGVDICPERQAGGMAHGLERLESFLTNRGETYRSAMSTPVAGADACSRLSPHLAWGTISMRQVAQATRARQRELRALGSKGSWRGSMRSFAGRLHWHCHFMQKLEDEPTLEHRNLHPAYDGVRSHTPDHGHLDAWSKGQTGLPFVDACMRSLAATGWMNFRMRAMLAAVASCHLWLDWRGPGEHLARLFTDYEPGIHWPQMQMQTGTTGINTIRIYNPVKQGLDQDPNGDFVRRWVPELVQISDRFIHEPWKAENAGLVLGRTYPFPIIDHLEAAKQARQKIWAVRRGTDFRETASNIQAKHGSRKSGMPMTGRTVKRPKKENQLVLPLSQADRS